MKWVCDDHAGFVWVHRTQCRQSKADWWEDARLSPNRLSRLSGCCVCWWSEGWIESWFLIQRVQCAIDARIQSRTMFKNSATMERFVLDTKSEINSIRRIIMIIEMTRMRPIGLIKTCCVWRRPVTQHSIV